MEEILQAIVLGIVQGLTEFLPISSSGHLVVARDLFGWEFSDELTFDVALHVGTTVAVVVYFWNEWIMMARAIFGRVSRSPVDEVSGAATIFNERLLLLLVIGSIPTAIVGLLFDAFLEDEVRKPVIVGVALIVGGLVLLAADTWGRRTRDLKALNWKDAAIVGGAQAMALVPGVSRSGITISAGLFRDINRQDAARFSFLLLTPAIAGAALLKSAEAIKDGIPSGDLDILVAGAITSAIVGWLSIRFLLRLVQFGTYRIFVYYRFVAGAFIILYFAL
jgi:undecaprenyl-diphosphatase